MEGKQRQVKGGLHVGLGFAIKMGKNIEVSESGLIQVLTLPTMPPYLSLHTRIPTLVA